MARKTKEEALETRTKLLDTAETVFHAHGVAGTSLAQIAEAAGMTRGAIYWHFDNKSDLLNALFERVHLPLEAMIENRVLVEQHNPLGELEKTVHYFLHEIVHNPHNRYVFDILFHRCEYTAELGPFIARDREHRTQGRDRLRRIFQNAIDCGQAKRELNIERTIVGFYSLTCGLMHNWLLAPDEFDLEQDGAALISQYLQQLRA